MLTLDSVKRLPAHCKAHEATQGYKEITRGQTAYTWQLLSVSSSLTSDLHRKSFNRVGINWISVFVVSIHPFFVRLLDGEGEVERVSANLGNSTNGEMLTLIATYVPPKANSYLPKTDCVQVIPLLMCSYVRFYYEWFVFHFLISYTYLRTIFKWPRSPYRFTLSSEGKFLVVKPFFLILFCIASKDFI